MFPPHQEQVTNKLEPVVFLLNVSLNEAAVEPKQTLQDLDAFPVLSDQQQLTEKAEVHRYLYTYNTCNSKMKYKATARCICNAAFNSF